MNHSELSAASIVCTIGNVGRRGRVESLRVSLKNATTHAPLISCNDPLMYFLAELELKAIP